MSKILDQLRSVLSKIPHLNNKMVHRLALEISCADREFIDTLIDILSKIKTDVSLCPHCYYILEGNNCELCDNPKRDRSKICVITNIIDVFSIERSLCYKGYYHVLHGSLSALDGIGPSDIFISPLIDRIKKSVNEIGNIEVIMSLESTISGHATRHFIMNEIRALCYGDKITISMPAQGIPLGSALECLDNATIHAAFSSRVVL